MKKTFDNKTVLWIQAIAITLVILGHSYPTEYIFEEITFFRRLLLCFQMGLFFSISGFLFASKMHKYRSDATGFIKKKAMVLGIPYLFVTTLAFFVKVPLSAYALRPIDWSFRQFLHGLVYPWDNPNVFLWFIPTLFVLFLVFIALAKVYDFRNHYLNALLFLLLAFVCYRYSPFHRISTPLNYYGCLRYLVFFYAGMLLSVYKPQIASVFNRKYSVVAFCLFSLAVLLPLQFMKEEIYLLTGLVGIAFIWSLSHLLRHTYFRLPEIIGRYAFQLFLFSWFGHQVVIILCWKILGWSENTCILLSFVAGMGVPLLLCYGVEKYLRSGSKIRMVVGL